MRRSPGEADPPPLQAGRPTRPAAPRYFQHDDRLRSIHPDALGVLRRGERTWPFFLEWERRAVRPVTMAARIAPYLRYYSSHRPTDDHGSQPAVLVVFEDEIAQTYFPVRGEGRDGAGGGESSAPGVPHEPVGKGGAAGTGMEDNRVPEAFTRLQVNSTHAVRCTLLD